MRIVESVVKFFSLWPKLIMAPGQTGAVPPLVSLCIPMTVLWEALESVRYQAFPSLSTVQWAPETLETSGNRRH